MTAKTKSLTTDLTTARTTENTTLNAAELVRVTGGVWWLPKDTPTSEKIMTFLWPLPV
jgi:hypothetical protein